MPTKLEYVTKVLTELGNTDDLDINSAMTVWWQDPRDNGGMRLTGPGHVAFQQAKIQHWRFEIPAGTPARPVQLLMLKQHLTTPYHLGIGKNPCITFYGSREATMFALYGNIDKFVQALRNNG